MKNKKPSYRQLEASLKRSKLKIKNLENIALLQRDLFNETIDELFHFRNLVTDNLRIRRVITGKQGCGKTTFIKENVLPKLKNYMIIDANNEFKSISDHLKIKLYFKNKSTLSGKKPYTDVEKINRIERAMLKHPYKTFIMDDAGWIFNNSHLRYRFFSFVAAYKIDLIITLQNINKLERLHDYFDVYFTFPGVSNMEPDLYENIREKIIPLISLKPSIF